MKIFLAHASAFDFRTKLYEPLVASELSKTHELILPEEEKYKGTWNTKDAIRGCGLLIADVSLPSTGAGIELGWADADGIPVIAIHEKGTVPSTVIQYLTETVIQYESPEDLLAKLSAAIEQLDG